MAVTVTRSFSVFPFAGRGHHPFEDPAAGPTGLGDALECPPTKSTQLREGNIRRRTIRGRYVSLLAGLAGLIAVSTAGANPAFYAGPAIFGISTGNDGRLLVADFGQGVVDGDTGELIAELPFVADVDPIAGTDDLWAITQSPGDPTVGGFQYLYRIDGEGNARRVADLYAYEAKFDPDGQGPDSNPFDVEDHNGVAIVTDAGADAVLSVGLFGIVRTVAVFPNELVSSANASALLGIPLPPLMDADPVPTSLAIGPDGAYYVGELKGFPAPLGESRVWRIEPGTRYAHCARRVFLCSVALDGLTSIIDLTFGPDGRLYVAQIEDKSWLAFEAVAFGGAPIPLGGSVHACTLATGACQRVVSGQPGLTSITFRNSALWGATRSFLPGLDVTPLLP
jgi:hypothetical protein